MEQKIGELIGSIRAPGPRAPDFIRRACVCAWRAYPESSENGEAVLAHTTKVAELIGAWGLGALTMSAALLSKLPLSGETLIREIEEELGTHLRMLVERLRTLSLVSFEVSIPQSVKSFSTFFIATAQDLRVLIIKIAEHLVLLREAASFPTGEAKRLALEALKLYVPIADRLGMYEAVKELENLAFSILHPRIYKKLSRSLALQEQAEVDAMSQFVTTLSHRLQEEGIAEPLLEKRTKTIYNIYRKMRRKGVKATRLYDIHAIRVIVTDWLECYQALGIIHLHYRPIQGRIKDYIALPKQNDYQSLHTTILTDDGIAVEIQIRTRKMHYHAQFGFATHATYKHPHVAEMLLWFPYFFPPPVLEASDTADPAWSQKLPEWITSLTDPRAYVSPSIEEHNSRQFEFLKMYIFVFNPAGLVTKLNRHATVADYLRAHKISVHDTATLMIRVNDAPATSETVLDTADIVDISKPSSGYAGSV